MTWDKPECPKCEAPMERLPVGGNQGVLVWECPDCGEQVEKDVS